MPSGGAVGAGTAPIPLYLLRIGEGLTRSILPTTPMPGPISGTRVCDTRIVGAGGMVIVGF